MAKTDVVDSDSAKAATELKKELMRRVRCIVEDDDCSIEMLDEARETLGGIKELEMRKRWVGLEVEEIVKCCPEEFKCPISKELMRDPVIVSTGQTYDRPFIQKVLKSDNRICPQTQQVLSDTSLIPNNLVRDMISHWCEDQGIRLSDPALLVNEEGITSADREQLISLLRKMSSALPEQKKAAKELRMLTKRIPSFRAFFGESLNAITQLLTPLSEGKFESGIQLELQEDVITTLLNLSIHENNKKLVAETPMVIPLLIEALQSGTVQTRSNAAATIFTLSALDSNKALIGESGAMEPLIDLLDEGNPFVMKDVMRAIFNLCVTHENKERAVAVGAVKTILNKLIYRVHVDELLTILALLSSNPKAVKEMGDLGAVPCLLSIMKDATICDLSKENCITVLYSICINDRTKRKEMREEEKYYRTISELAKNGTSRAKRKAGGVLDRIYRGVNLTHTA